MYFAAPKRGRAAYLVQKNFGLILYFRLIIRRKCAYLVNICFFSAAYLVHMCLVLNLY